MIKKNQIVFYSDLNFVLGRYYGESKNYELANENLDLAISLAERENLYEELSQALEFKAKYLREQERFEEALNFTIKMGKLSEEQGHHPLLTLEWGKVSVVWWTHKIKDLHINDFIIVLSRWIRIKLL